MWLYACSLLERFSKILISCYSGLHGGMATSAAAGGIRPSTSPAGLPDRGRCYAAYMGRPGGYWHC